MGKIRVANSVAVTSINNKLRSIGVSPLGIASLLLLAVAPLLIRNEFIIHILIASLLFGSLAMAFDFTTGYIGIVNFGFAAFWGLGAYVSALSVINFGIPIWLGLLLGSASAGFLGFLTGLLTLRLRGIFAACFTWFLGLTLLAILANLVGITRGYLGLNVPLFFATAERTPYFYIMLILALLTLFVLRSVVNSHIGLAFKAIKQDLDAAQASGVNPTRYKVINFTLSCTFAGLLGGFYGHFIGILTPDILHTRYTIEILALAYIGGRGSLWGGLAAAFILIPIMEYLRPLMEVRLIMYGVLLILVMIFYPGGFAAAYKGIGKYVARYGKG